MNLVSDGLGGVYYLASGRLRHLRADETDVPVAGAWPTDGFQPGALAIGQDGAIWIGGSGGLYRFTVFADNVVKYQPISTSDIRTNTIDAVMTDHRGWVWIGTALGVSVYDGQRWVSVDASTGLLSNDVDEGGVREDPDGSIWITTTQGVSHLRDPKSLFFDRPVRAVVSSAELGDRPVFGSRFLSPKTHYLFSSGRRAMAQSVRCDFGITCLAWILEMWSHLRVLYATRLFLRAIIS